MTLAIGSLDELPKTLIQARIAAGLTQEELAAKLGLRPQQIQRYEATDYRSAIMHRMNEVLRALGVRLCHPVELRFIREARRHLSQNLRAKGLTTLADVERFVDEGRA
jgi:transcriptional regulator with XRE-family HTH domain